MRRGSPGIVVHDAQPADTHARVRPPILVQEPLVEAKLAAPYLRPEVLPRDSLLPRLLGADSGLVTIVAPPGYGKSTCLALWRAKEPRPVGWVTVDAADADPIRFLSYVALAIERALRSRKPDRRADRRNGRLRPVQRRPAADVGAPRARAADGADARRRAPPRRDPVGRRAGDGGRLPAARDHGRRGRAHRRRAAARAAPRERPARRDRGRRPRARRAGGRPAGGARRARSCRRTRPATSMSGPRAGPPRSTWPRAARSARAAANGRSAAPIGVSGRDTDIGDYLDAELARPRDAAGARVPAAHGVLDRMTADLCDAVVDGTGSDRILRDLASTNQLVVPLDTAGRLVPLPHAAARAPARDARARPGLRGRAQPPRGGVVRRQRHARARRRPPVRRERSGRRRRAGLRSSFRGCSARVARRRSRAGSSSSTTTACGGSRSSPRWARGCTRSGAAPARRSGWPTS